MMSTPEQKIAALEAEIDGYSEELKKATDIKEKSELRQLITERGRTLNRLLDAQAAAIAGNAPPSRDSLRFICSFTPILKLTHSVIILYF
jgi:hypothetical protein